MIDLPDSVFVNIDMFKQSRDGRGRVFMQSLYAEFILFSLLFHEKYFLVNQ